MRMFLKVLPVSLQELCEFTRILWIQLNPSPFTFGWKTHWTQQVQKKSMRMFLKMLLASLQKLCEFSSTLPSSDVGGKHNRPNKFRRRAWGCFLKCYWWDYKNFVNSAQPFPLQMWVDNTIDPTRSEEEHEDVFLKMLLAISQGYYEFNSTLPSSNLMR